AVGGAVRELAGAGRSGGGAGGAVAPGQLLPGLHALFDVVRCGPQALAADQVGDLLQVARVAVDRERGQDGLLPALDLVGDLGPGADQGHVLDQLGGNGRDRTLLIPGQVEVLDGAGFGLVAHPDEYLVVKVDPPGAPPADVQSQGRADEIGRPFGVIVDDDGQRSAHYVEGFLALPRSGAGEALGQGGGVEVVHRG